MAQMAITASQDADGFISMNKLDGEVDECVELDLLEDHFGRCFE